MPALSSRCPLITLTLQRRATPACKTTIGMQFVKESLIHATPERVFAFHEQPDALTALTPPWEKLTHHSDCASPEIGSRAIVETTVFGPLKVSLGR